MNRRHLIIAAALIITACSAPPVRPAKDKVPRLPPNAVAVTVEVTEQVAADAWEVTWSFSRPVDGLRFNRDVTRFRAASWTLDDTSARFVELGAAEGLVPTTGSLRRVTARFPSDGAAPPDEDLVIRYGDGARLLHTAPLMVTPLECFRPSACKPTELEPPHGYVYHWWRLGTDAGRHLMLAAQRGLGTLKWDQPRDTTPGGHLAYFGPAAPVSTETAHLAADATLPAWLGGSLQATASNVLAFYARATGHPPVTLPSVWVSWSDTALPGRFSSAALAESSVRLELRGAGWAQDTPDTRHEWQRRLAQSLYRLWSEQLVPVGGGRRSAWLAAGSADHMATAALLDAALLDWPTADRWTVRQANRCLLRLGGRSLEEAGLARDHVATEACGAVIHALVDRAEGGVVGPLASLDGPGPHRELARRLVTEGVAASADRALHDALAAAGLKVELVPLSDALVDPAEVRALLVRTLTECDCGRSLTARPMEGGLLVRGRHECDVFAADYPLAAIDGHGVLDDPGGAWGALATAIRKLARFELGRVDGTKARTRKCPVAVLDPSWERLLKAP